MYSRTSSSLSLSRSGKLRVQTAPSSVIRKRSACSILPRQAAQADNTTGPSAASMEAAVRENRMVSPQEANIRKAIGVVSAAITAYQIYSQGVDALSPEYLTCMIGGAIAFLGTGFLNLCGCAIGLLWSVEGFRLGATRCPANYEEFMKGKRRQWLSVLAVSAVSSGLLTVALYSLLGQNHVMASLLPSVAKGDAIFVVFMLVWSTFTGRDLAYKFGL